MSLCRSANIIFTVECETCTLMLYWLYFDPEPWSLAFPTSSRLIALSSEDIPLVLPFLKLRRSTHNSYSNLSYHSVYHTFVTFSCGVVIVQFITRGFIWVSVGPAYCMMLLQGVSVIPLHYLYRHSLNARCVPVFLLSWLVTSNLVGMYISLYCIDLPNPSYNVACRCDNGCHVTWLLVHGKDATTACFIPQCWHV